MLMGLHDIQVDTKESFASRKKLPIPIAILEIWDRSISDYPHYSYQSIGLENVIAEADTLATTRAILVA